MDVAKEFVAHNKEEGKPFGVVAETQVKGRGSEQRQWVSPKGNLYFTLAIPEKLISTELLPVLSLVVGLACRNAVLTLLPSLSPESIRTKWPNDLVFNHEKIAGTIGESVSTYFLLGIGINVHIAPPLTDGGRPSTCLDAVVKSLNGATPVVPSILATAVWNEFFALLCNDSWNRKKIVEEFEKSMDKSLELYRRLPAGRDSTPLKAKRLNDWGHLVVETPDGKEETLTAEYLF